MNLFLAFGAKPALGGGFGSFGQPSGLPAFGQAQGQQQQQQQQYQLMQQQQPALNPDEAFAESIYKVSIFGDERDIVIAKWNFLQAMWGHGKAFYAKNLPPVEITPQNVRILKIHFKILSTISIGIFFLICIVPLSF